ncbi:hypothetical protein FA10DRAFT_303346 [Acaromyces ingoldii]|uniref:Uncharacterized protein n=1 Tax=Acaromyces ingoldii TaxID=215250 RepID=A0A316YKX9_9BASI|nr:hypothetical protein FA10DRAFT_303346 [Acaromyces ingoldii]PWN88375.1 hypothetical protein FA10DRAFT_303346 [Acaromyces ingoldii]
MKIPSSRLLTLSFLIFFTTFLVVTEGSHDRSSFVKRIINPNGAHDHLPTSGEVFGAKEVDPATTTEQKRKKKTTPTTDPLYDDAKDLAVGWLRNMRGPVQLVQMTPKGKDKYFLSKFIVGQQYEFDYTENCKAFGNDHFLPKHIGHWSTNKPSPSKFLVGRFAKRMMPLCSISTLPELLPEQTGLFVLRASMVIVTKKWSHPRIIKPKGGGPARKVTDFSQITWLNEFFDPAMERFQIVDGREFYMEKIGKVVYNRADLMAIAEPVLNGHKPDTSTL